MLPASNTWPESVSTRDDMQLLVEMMSGCPPERQMDQPRSASWFL